MAAGINKELIYAGALKDTARVIWMVVHGIGNIWLSGMSGYLIRYAASSYAAGTKGWEGDGGRGGKAEKFDWCDPRWKTCRKKSGAYNLIVRLLFCPDEYELAKEARREKP